jgi:hypothetical protein
MADETPPPPAPSGGFRINEDWAATILGLLLVVLILSGVITKGILQ